MMSDVKTPVALGPERGKTLELWKLNQDHGRPLDRATATWESVVKTRRLVARKSDASGRTNEGTVHLTEVYCPGKVLVEVRGIGSIFPGGFLSCRLAVRDFDA